MLCFAANFRWEVISAKTINAVKMNLKDRKRPAQCSCFPDLMRAITDTRNLFWWSLQYVPYIKKIQQWLVRRAWFWIFHFLRLRCIWVCLWARPNLKALSAVEWTDKSLLLHSTADKEIWEIFTLWRRDWNSANPTWTSASQCYFHWINAKVRKD